VPGGGRRERHAGDADKDRERVEWMPDSLPSFEATLAVKVDLIERHRPGLNDQGCEKRPGRAHIFTASALAQGRYCATASKWTTRPHDAGPSEPAQLSVP